MLITCNKISIALHKVFQVSSVSITKMPSVSKRMKYTAKFKLLIVKFAEESNNWAASREFRINEKLGRDWRKQIEKLEFIPKTRVAPVTKNANGLSLKTNSWRGSRGRDRMDTS